LFHEVLQNHVAVDSPIRRHSGDCNTRSPPQIASWPSSRALSSDRSLDDVHTQTIITSLNLVRNLGRHLENVGDLEKRHQPRTPPITPLAILPHSLHAKSWTWQLLSPATMHWDGRCPQRML